MYISTTSSQKLITRFSSSETDFITRIEKSEHSASCVKISIKSKIQKYVKNSLWQYQTH